MLCRAAALRIYHASFILIFFFYFQTKFSLWIDSLVETRLYSMLSLHLIVISFRFTEEKLLFETDLSGPFSFIRMCSLPLNGTHFLYLFIV